MVVCGQPSGRSVEMAIVRWALRMLMAFASMLKSPLRIEPSYTDASEDYGQQQGRILDCFDRVADASFEIDPLSRCEFDVAIFHTDDHAAL